jgi:bifunctional DNA-binding transcriptional regulator/antitoxin component of YhaV-PrlF toxin-antitoxin module
MNKNFIRMVTRESRVKLRLPLPAPIMKELGIKYGDSLFIESAVKMMIVRKIKTNKDDYESKITKYSKTGFKLYLPDDEVFREDDVVEMYANDGELIIKKVTLL